MIGKLNGKIDSHCDDYVIIDVNGVGYLVYASGKTLAKLVEGKFYKLFIETHVREEHIHLYGFLTLEEKNFFNLLQSVNGIGTKMALSILSNLTPTDIQIAINNDDRNIFKAISGVGAKLAERIMLELKDKITKIFSSSAIIKDSNISSIAINEVMKALVNLGFTRFEAQNTVQGIITQNPKISIDELIKTALKNRNSSF
ncbi:Holliday junction branch migration protein RuvA [Rickettsia prowazekii]|uniref:Holliday junction branch migration complex subunit RuvA n=2 Tax=Rickettsia prowazekii TaxID=782 RepID=RUVA_RICPR|nr:Holliday junction branch migration protein RuvA [Rickettsia prowazekii]Q9ZDE6.1 RecName: Full=Holliday junction branch migration complex subunit RuvA [Rickettsia prowazekii str. Madrid E]EOB09750.1 Holliday junction ATP-dependent DNA helicase RuvA [Rickettsia prowazekii str. GvF12]ADE29909.1 Holliday junction DNA helicase RuvA [Rickettsia prowazekii str. Rp22]AFE49199.1 Holliday junction DNA helicase RuvA [Rickettsia prowazekii str. Chernikova]AFE50045.1 Holliday junction DNA helicase RuvA 